MAKLVMMGASHLRACVSAASSAWNSLASPPPLFLVLCPNPLLLLGLSLGITSSSKTSLYSTPG